MDVTCERCNTEYEFDDALVSDQGTSVRCTQCGHRFKVKRRDSAVAPEVWIVRTVEGKTLEFRALRELKVAIGAGRVGRDDVLSRGAGRPRRLASIAELEPFFTQAPMFSTHVGLGAVESNRARSATPAGLGPVGPTQDSVAIPLPSEAKTAVNITAVNVPPPTRLRMDTNPFEDEEITRSRTLTQELRALGEERPPESVEPKTIPERDKFPPENGPTTKIGVTTTRIGHPKDPSEIDPEGLIKTAAYGTPQTKAASDRPPKAAPPKATPPKTPSPGKLGPLPPPTPPPNPAARQPSTPPPPPVAAPAPAPAPAQVATPAPPPVAPVAAAEAAEDRPQVLPPPPDPTRAPAPKPAPTPPPREVAIREAEPEPTGDGRRVSLMTPTPAEVRYSLSGEEGGEVVPSERRVSAAATSRRSGGSMRLIVSLLVGGGLIFGGILVVQRYVLKPTASSATPDKRVDGLLEEGDKALADGDVEGASKQYLKASGLAESDPRVARALAKVAVVKAEVPWLELLLLPQGDSGRDAVRRTYQSAAAEALTAANHAKELAPNDPEVSRLVLDARRLSGDIPGARKLADDLRSIALSPETQLALAALDLASQSPEWDAVTERLAKAADGEGNLGRARGLLVYAFARSRKIDKARAELEKLAKLPRPHPLEAALRRYVDRVEKGEDVALRLEDLPSTSASGSPAVESAPLKAAQEALAKGDVKGAEKMFQKIVDGDPNNADALLGLSQIAKKNGQTPLAKSYLERILKGNASYLPAVSALADMRWDGGDVAGARVLYKKAIELGATGPLLERAKERAQPAGTPVDTSSSSGSGTPTATAEPTAPPTTTATEIPPFGDPPPAPL